MPQPRCSWFRDHIRQVHLDFHTPEFPEEAISRFNAGEFVDRLEFGRVNLVALFAKCHFGNTYYDTKIGHKHCRLSRDFLMETAAECRRRGIRTLAYYSLCWDRRAWDEHANWRYVDREGKTPGADQPWANVCMNTGYKAELVLPQLEELARAYPVDGFFIDIPVPYTWRDTCYCPSCVSKWKREWSIDLTANTPGNVRQRTVSQTTIDWLRDIRALMARTNPELVVCVNAANHFSSSKEVRELCDLGVCESQPQGANHLAHSFVARTLRNDFIDGQVMTVRFVEGWGDMTLKPEAQLLTEVASMIGNGAVACVGDQVNLDGTLDAAVYDTFRRVFGFVEERESLLRHAESVRHAAVLLPVPDEVSQFGAGVLDDIDSGRAGWWGSHRMLVESHVQVDLVYSVLANELSRYPIVILPEPACYQPGMYARLSEYVSAGGTLIAVGTSLLVDGQMELEDMFGLRYVGVLPFSVAHFVPSPVLEAAPAAQPLQFRGQVQVVELNGARELAAVHLPVSENQPPSRAFRSPYPPARRERSPHPFASVHTFGRGKAVYVAGSIFAAYHHHNHHWLRRFMASVLCHVDAAPPYEIDGPLTLEANLMHVPDGLLLNLINYSLSHHPGPLSPRAISAIEQVTPVFKVPCGVRTERATRVTLRPEGTPIPFQIVGQFCRFTVPEVKHLTMAHVETQSASASDLQCLS